MVTKAIDYEVLHEQILAGEVPIPSVFTIRGRGYRRWLIHNKSPYEPELAKLLPRLRFDSTLRPPTSYGFKGQGSGHTAVVSGSKEWQTTTNLGAGFSLNVIGAPAPVLGGPLGRHTQTAAEVGCDAMNWFKEGIIANPSAFILSLPGLGKSTLVRKMLMAHVAQGHIPIIAGDIKGEYVGFCHQVGGQVITIGHGEGHINPLDVGALGRIIPVLEDNKDVLISRGKQDLIERAYEQVHGRQVTMVSTLVGLGRGEKIADWEAMLISAGLRELYSRGDINWDHPPVVKDLIEVLEQGSPRLAYLGRARDTESWNRRIDHLILSLNSLLDGATGKIFSGQTTTPIDVNAAAVCIDVSSIDRGDSVMKAAVMMACWSAAFGAIEASHLLADAGLGRQRYFAATLDEMWQVLSSAPGMVAQVDALTRLNRTDGTALYMITHTFKDLEALPTEEDRKTAMGFIERAGMVICGGLPTSELDILASRLEFSDAEAHMITSWSRGAHLKRSRTTGAKPVPPGRGRFMIKPSKDGAPGIPVQTILLPSEIEYRLHDTNVRFDDFFMQGA
ncbi:ATP/GTP-binding protein [Corynebacterium sp. 3HC-13]|uniref:ATP/GTP-binding protein n=1 Tax=Corynebacterium poyangense TaxID=2684405 RepID=UPI001CCD15D7|nr:ATP/GTP-binding protein [Corynebacterium poyangense]MBZ8176213.1 ATP/GTP-binding protein [Corynebacterium poyangense]